MKLFNILEKLYLKNTNNIAFKDLLTGAYNRNYFEYNKNKFNNQQFLVVFIDINGLKELNDSTKSHYAGDELLKRVSKTLIDNFKNDIIIRFGGDEFLLLVKDNYSDVIENIEKISECFSYGMSLKLQFDNIDDVINEADRQMYQHKLNTKNKKGDD